MTSILLGKKEASFSERSSLTYVICQLSVLIETTDDIDPAQRWLSWLSIGLPCGRP